MQMRKKTALLLSALVLTGTLSACALMPDETQRKKENDVRFNNLLEINDLSERAFVYHQYCLKDGETINDAFMANFKTVSNLLLDEAVDHMKMPPELVVKRVLNRRKMIQQKLSEHYYSVGCQSDEGRIASAHYKTFSDMNEKQVKGLFYE